MIALFVMILLDNDIGGHFLLRDSSGHLLLRDSIYLTMILRRVVKSEVISHTCDITYIPQ